MRIKRGHSKNLKHKKVLKAVKGYRMSFSKLYRRALEAMWHAGQYSFAHRRKRRGQMRNEWIKIIAAGLSNTGVTYNKFIHGLTTKNIELDRKVLAEMAQTNPQHFAQVIEASK